MEYAVSTHLLAGRILMADTLGVHILFAIFGVGFPLLISLLELIGILKNDESYRQVARKLGFAMLVLFTVGAISGTVVALQLSTLWPNFMAVAGQIISLPFFLEGFAFAVEAVFLGIYFFSWDRFSKWTHWLCSIPIFLGSAASGFLITAVDAFMNAPGGFTLAPDGSVATVDIWRVIFNPATFTETTHTLLSCYTAVFVIMSAFFAYGVLKNRKRGDTAAEETSAKVLKVLASGALISSLLLIVVGDLSGRYLAQHEPLKLAMIEAHTETGPNAPLRILGWPDGNGGVTGSINVPSGLSFLVFDDPNAVVTGLDAFDRSIWPPSVIHYTFDFMVGIGFFIALVFILYVSFRTWRRSKTLLYGVIIAGVLAPVAIELGWMTTEIGRQPFILKDIMTTAQAFTTSPYVIYFAWLFPAFYAVLAVLTIWILWRHYRSGAAASSY